MTSNTRTAKIEAKWSAMICEVQRLRSMQHTAEELGFNDMAAEFEGKAARESGKMIKFAAKHGIEL